MAECEVNECEDLSELNARVLFHLINNEEPSESWYYYEQRKDQEWMKREGLNILLSDQMWPLAIACSNVPFSEFISEESVSCCTIQIVHIIESSLDQILTENDSALCESLHNKICQLSIQIIYRINTPPNKVIESLLHYAVNIINRPLLKLHLHMTVPVSQLLMSKFQCPNQDVLLSSLNSTTADCSFTSEWYSFDQTKIERIFTGIWSNWCLNNVTDRYQPDPYIIAGPDRLSAISLINHDTCVAPVRSAFAVKSGIYFYEAVPLSGGRLAFGWATREAKVTCCKVFDYDQHSIVFNCASNNIHHSGQVYPIDLQSSTRSTEPLVIGCLIDVQAKQFIFYVNGVALEFVGSELVHFSGEPYYAVASLARYERCFFNFGQCAFKYPPSGKKYRHFHNESIHYGLVPTHHVAHDYWFEQPVLSNQFELMYCSTKQIACDEAIQHLTNRILAQAEESVIDLTILADFVGSPVIQSMIEVMGNCSPELHNQMDVIAHLCGTIFTKKVDYENKEKLIELLHPYLQLTISSQDALNKHRIICITLIYIVNQVHIMKLYAIIHELHDDIWRFLFRSIVDSHDEWIILFALLACEEFDADSDVIRNNEQAMQIINRYRSSSQICAQSSSVQRQLHLVCCSLYGKRCKVSKLAEPIIIETEKATLNALDASRLLKLDSSLLSARHYSANFWCDGWQNVRSIGSARCDIFYFEVILLTSGPMSIGWATKRTELDKVEVGADLFSVAIDGFNRELRHDKLCHKTSHLDSNVPRWKEGDVVGCLIDVPNKKFQFFLPDRIIDISTASDVYFSTHPYYAAVSLNNYQQVMLNFGQYAFAYAPQLERIDYWSFQSYWEEIIQHQYINFTHNNLKRSIVLINSTLNCAKINYNQEIVQYSSTTNYEITNPPPKRAAACCQLCNSPTPTRVRFVCCAARNLCPNCAAKYTSCPKHRKAALINGTCTHCDETVPLLLQFECCDMIKFCKDCIHVLESCPKHN